MKFKKIPKRKNFVIALNVFLALFLVLERTDLVYGADLVPDDYADEVSIMPDVGYSGIDGPEVDVVFDDSEGDGTMTAKAISTGFNGGDEDLYFTWYLKRSGCGLDKDPSSDKKEKCDEDNDGKITENDWKVKAAKIIATNGYTDESNGSSSNDGNDDGYQAYPEWTGDNDEPNCYVQDFEDGGIYELKETEEVFTCANPVCVATKSLSCSGDSKQICQRQAEPDCQVTDAETFVSAGQCDGGTLLCLSGSFSSSLTDLEICSALGSSSGDSCESLSETVPGCSFVEKTDGNICQHLFAQPDDDLDEETGDDEFDDDEEEFWGTDPNNKFTAGNSNVDEANVVGLGVDEFTWNYLDGDKVGLVVEGESIIDTKHNDGTKMIMWAFSKNTCSAISDAIEERSFYIDDLYGLEFGILTVKDLDLNDCLEENLLDPSGESADGYLSVDLSVSPTEPKNDPLTDGPDNRGSVVTAIASVLQYDSPENLLYDWNVEVSSDGTNDPPLWKDITDELTEHSVLSGLGNSKLTFKLNLLYEDDIFPNQNVEQYLKIKVRASEGGDAAASGKDEYILKIKQLGPDVMAYDAAYSETTQKLSLGGELCGGDDEIGADCLVTVNQIIGLSVPNEDGNLSAFSWKKDGESLTCSSSISSGCSNGSSSNLAFFPVVGSIGDEIEITASAMNQSTGITETFSKKFKIIQPYVKIVSADSDLVWPKQLGYYKNLDGTVALDLSDKIFQVVEDTKVSLKATFYPNSIAETEGVEVVWKVLGESYKGEDEISFTASKNAGGSYNIEVLSTYSQPVSTRMALANIWGISQVQTDDEQLSYEIQVEVLKSEYDEVALLKNTKKFLANIISNTPEQVVFFLKIILSVVLLIGISGLGFRFIPGANNNE